MRHVRAIFFTVTRFPRHSGCIISRIRVVIHDRISCICVYNGSRCVLEHQRKPARIRDAVAVYSPSIQPAERRGNDPVKPRSAYAERHSVCDGLRLPLVVSATGGVESRVSSPRYLCDDLTIFPSLITFLGHQEIHHRTLFAVLPDSFVIEKLFDATEGVLGPLDQPNTGMMFALSVLHARGHQRI